jgi:hypothetical protein
MAVMYSYPHAIPALTDMIIGSKYYEDEGLLSKSFYISDIVSIVNSNLSSTLQSVSDKGNTILVGTTRNVGVDVTLSDLGIVGQAGFKVTIPSQTGSPYPTYYSSPDAYLAYINGQSPFSLPGFISGFGVEVHGADNYSFWSNHYADTSSSYHTIFKNLDGTTSDFASYRKVITGGSSDVVYRVDYLGNVTLKSIRLTTLNIAPTSSTDTGVLGEIRYDANYMYVCVATNTWKRTQFTSW